MPTAAGIPGDGLRCDQPHPYCHGHREDQNPPHGQLSFHAHADLLAPWAPDVVASPLERPGGLARCQVFPSRRPERPRDDVLVCAFTQQFVGCGVVESVGACQVLWGGRPSWCCVRGASCTRSRSGCRPHILAHSDRGRVPPRWSARPAPRAACSGRTSRRRDRTSPCYMIGGNPDIAFGGCGPRSRTSVVARGDERSGRTCE